MERVAVAAGRTHPAGRAGGVDRSTGEPAGTVFAVQRCSLHDGPGIRTTVFLKGLPAALCLVSQPREHRAATASCWSTPGAASPARRLSRSLRPQRRPAPARRTAGSDGCAACGACVAACPTGAREVVGREMTVDELMAEIGRTARSSRSPAAG